MTGLRIKTVASLTGLSPERLRAWERRHGVVQPRRTPGGYREYTDADVHRLCLLRDLTERGFTIGEIASLGPAEIEEIAQRADRGAGPAPPRRRSVHAERLLGPAVELDAHEIGRALRRTLALLPANEVIAEALLPLVGELADRTRREPDLQLALELVAGEIRGLLGVLAAELPPGAGIVLVAAQAEAPRPRVVAAQLACLAAGLHPLALGGADEHLVERALALGAGTVLLVCADAHLGRSLARSWQEPPRLLVFDRPHPPGIPATARISSVLDLLDALRPVEEEDG